MSPWTFESCVFVAPAFHRWEFGVGICGGLGFAEGQLTKEEDGPVVIAGV